MYGRARRLALARNIVIGIILVLIGYNVIKSVFFKEEWVDDNVNFSYLKWYLQGEGFTCEPIEKSGNRCYKKTDVKKENFIRYNNGFNYSINATSYSLSINYLQTEKNKIVFKTNDKALKGYKNKTYYCVTVDDNIFSEIKECKSNLDELLDSKSYLTAITSGMSDLNDIIDASGYNKDVLLKKYIWEK